MLGWMVQVTKQVMEESFDQVAQGVQVRMEEGVAGLLMVHHLEMVQREIWKLGILVDLA